MRLCSRIRLLSTCWLVVSSSAFAPRLSPTRPSSALAARYTPPLPPPPPPPPPLGDQSWLDKVTKDLSSLSLEHPQQSVDSLLQQLTKALDNLKLPQLPSQIAELESKLREFDQATIASLERMAEGVQRNIVADLPLIQPAVDKVLQMIKPLLQSPSATLLISGMVTYLFVSTLLSLGALPPPSKPYPLSKYDPIAARAYFDQHLPAVLARGLEILLQSLQFGVKVLKDVADNKMELNDEQRGRELAQLLTKLGPTFIKVGQSLSIRTDLLSPGYVRGLATLQDQVPPFDTAVAEEILEREWGRPVSAILATPLSLKPVAAASLGQVYRARLKSTGQEVAIKVQRPDIENQIALDMHLLREAAPIFKQLFNLNTDTVGTVDAWGSGFVDELDYLQEASNAAYFSSSIAETPLKEVVFAPKVVDEYSTGMVLVTEWIDGERLDQSSSDDVTVLCSIAMNTYLTMLLEVGLLHCDPHPGNLLRTPDGRLCILDWGMVTRLDPNLQLTLIEHMAHLTSSDYAEVPRDLLLLGFIPESKANAIEDSGVVNLLAEIYGAWSSGGGAAAINVNQVISQLQDLQAEKGNIFQIPPYFAYIAKSFSVLEGIGLSNNPKYSIINECLPYVSKRLLTDKEAMGPALSTFIFGPNKHNEDRIVDYHRVEQLLEGFGDYTTSTAGALLGKDSATRTEKLEDVADQILDLVFTEEETPLQEIVIEQMAKIIAAASRSIFTQIRERSGVLPTGRTLLGTMVDPLGLFRTSPLVRMNKLDEKTVETTRKLFELLQKRIQESDNSILDPTTLSREEAVALASILIRKVWARRSGVIQTGNRLAREMLLLTAKTLEHGERDSRLLPEREKPKHEESSSPATRPRLEARPTERIESPRLQQARMRLNQLQSEDADVPVRVRNTL